MEKWFAADFDDTSWKLGEPGFCAGLPGIRTPWTTADIWLRKEFTLTAKPDAPLLRVLHDEGVEVYLNGVLACRDGDFLTAYDDFPITAEAAATLHPGKNVIAVHCHQTTGGQYIDVGLLEVRPETTSPPQ